MADNRECDTCAYKEAESVDADGGRIVDCELNELQMYAPYADDCEHWEKSPDA